MLRVLVDAAREKQALRRRGDPERLELTDLSITIECSSLDPLTLDDGLKRLEQERSQAANAVKLRLFAGLTNAATWKPHRPVRNHRHEGQGLSALCLLAPRQTTIMCTNWS